MPKKSYKVFLKASTDVWVLLPDNFRSHLRQFSGKLSGPSEEAVSALAPPASVLGNVSTVEPRACTSQSKHMGLGLVVKSWVSLFFVFVHVM